MSGVPPRYLFYSRFSAAGGWCSSGYCVRDRHQTLIHLSQIFHSSVHRDPATAPQHTQRQLHFIQLLVLLKTTSGELVHPMFRLHRPPA